MKNKQLSKVRLNEFDAQNGYNRDASKFKDILWYLTKVVFFLSPIPFPYRLKRRILITFGASIGVGLVIKPRVNIHMPWKLSIGNDVWIGEEASILNFENITIGNNVCVSQRVFLCGGNHDYTDPAMPYRNGEIVLKDGCWIGANSFIGPNLTIGVDTVVSAGSVVTRNLESNGIYKGNPAEFIKARWG